MSINYNDYSRRGLVAMNKMFDADNDQMLSGYVSEVEEANAEKFEQIRPIEKMIDTIDRASDSVKKSGDTVSQAVADRIDSLFEGVVNQLSAEAQRCAEILNEHEDDDIYPDEEDGE